MELSIVQFLVKFGEVTFNLEQQTGQRIGQDQLPVRADDKEKDVFNKRVAEFKEKTMPVMNHYQQLGLLVPVLADMTREEVMEAVVDKLYQFATKK